jgi:predicted aminopeptidase
MIPGDLAEPLAEDLLNPLMPRYPLLLLALLVALVPSCQTVRFYRQAVGGQMEILRKSRPNAEVLADPATSPVLRRQLTSVERIRRFASDHLSLPGDESYGKHADLGRKHVVWVLYAAPEFSLKPKKWHYPAIGEMNYRGYFHERDTVAMARQLKNGGYDVFVGGVDAYSTLGWFHDPVLNTFIDYPDIDLAETIFHELTHRKVFRRGNTVFNESLASTVAEEGVKRWLNHEGRLADLRKYEGRLLRRREFYQEVNRSRGKLEALYASSRPAPEMREEKRAILANLRDQFRELRRRWGGHGLEGWLHENINNGHIVSLNLYADHMPPFQRLLADCGGDLNLFYQKSARLKLP